MSGTCAGCGGQAAEQPSAAGRTCVGATYGSGDGGTACRQGFTHRARVRRMLCMWNGFSPALASGRCVGGLEGTGAKAHVLLPRVATCARACRCLGPALLPEPPLPGLYERLLCWWQVQLSV